MTSLRRDAIAVWKAGVDAVHAGALVRRAVNRRGDRLSLCGLSVDLRRVSRLVVVGAGKAGGAMALALDSLLDEPRVSGRVNVPERDVRPLRRIVLHPARRGFANEPTAAGEAGARRMLAMIRDLGRNDLVICLLSGGGSALLPAPSPGLTLDDKRRVTRLLHASGAAIREVNTVRKHLSEVKGGRLAAATRARVVGLVVSDVVGDSLDVIASGPTVPDPTTFEDALSVLEERGLTARVPARVLAHLRKGASGGLPETPKRLGPRVRNRILAGGATALEAAKEEAQRRGYRVIDLGACIEGESREAGIVLAGIARGARARGERLCILSGGETTVTLGRSPGKGGRNQELALGALLALSRSGARGIAVLSGGTDGEDGPTDAAGAVADDSVLRAMKRLCLDPMDFLERHDAYRFFEKTGGLLRTGPTGTNVMDLRIVLVTG